MNCGCIPEIDQTKAPRVARPDTGVDCSCGRSKKKRDVFCSTCYAQLPGWAKRNLREASPESYSTAYDEARDWLIKFGR